MVGVDIIRAVAADRDHGINNNGIEADACLTQKERDRERDSVNNYNWNQFRDQLIRLCPVPNDHQQQQMKNYD